MTEETRIYNGEKTNSLVGRESWTTTCKSIKLEYNLTSHKKIN